MESKEKNKPSETITDFKISWQLFKENYKAFIATEVFAFLALIIFYLLFLTIVVIVFAALPNFTPADLIPRFPEYRKAPFILTSVISVLAYLVVSGFLYCQFGLAYDIISSGDMFTEFKKAFSYFKEHWWKYILLTFVTGFGFFLPDRRGISESPLPLRNIFEKWFFLLVIIRFFILFFLLVLFSGTLPSVTAQGSLKNSFIESFRIVKKDYKRLLSTWGIYFLTFSGPVFILSLIMAIIIPSIIGTFWLPIFSVLLLLAYLYKLFIGFPFLSLIATRIYNSVEFKRFKPLTTSKEEIIKEVKK
jgi:hypothetical protein